MQERVHTARFDMLTARLFKVTHGVSRTSGTKGKIRYSLSLRFRCQ